MAWVLAAGVDGLGSGLALVAALVAPDADAPDADEEEEEEEVEVAEDVTEVELAEVDVTALVVIDFEVVEVVASADVDLPAVASEDVDLLAVAAPDVVVEGFAVAEVAGGAALAAFFVAMPVEVVAATWTAVSGGEVFVELVAANFALVEGVDGAEMLAEFCADFCAGLVAGGAAAGGAAELAFVEGDFFPDDEDDEDDVEDELDEVDAFEDSEDELDVEAAAAFDLPLGAEADVLDVPDCPGDCDQALGSVSSGANTTRSATSAATTVYAV
jgi:hypothetical protein